MLFVVGYERVYFIGSILDAIGNVNYREPL